MAHSVDQEKADFGSDLHDYQEHERTYTRFTGMVKWGTIGLAAFMVLLYIVVNP